MTRCSNPKKSGFDFDFGLFWFSGFYSGLSLGNYKSAFFKHQHQTGHMINYDKVEILVLV